MSLLRMMHTVRLSSPVKQWVSMQNKIKIGPKMSKLRVNFDFLSFQAYDNFQSEANSSENDRFSLSSSQGMRATISNCSGKFYWF